MWTKGTWAAFAAVVLALVSNPPASACSYCVNDCTESGFSPTGGDRGSYFCSLDNETHFDQKFETVSESHRCFNRDQEPTAHWVKRMYEDYYMDPFPNSAKKKCAEYCVTGGVSCRGFSVKTSGTGDWCVLHSSDPDNPLGTSSYGFTGPFEEDNGYAIAGAASSSGSGACFVKPGMLSSVRTTTSTATEPATTTEEAPEEEEDEGDTRYVVTDSKSHINQDNPNKPNQKPGGGPMGTGGIVTFSTVTFTTRRPLEQILLGHKSDGILTRGDGPHPDDISAKVEASLREPKEKHIFGSGGETFIVKSDLKYLESAVTDEEKQWGRPITIQDLVGGSSLELHAAGSDDGLTMSDVLAAKDALISAGSTVRDGTAIGFGSGSVLDVDRGAIVVEIEDSAALAALDAAGVKAAASQSGAELNSAQPHAGLVRALLGGDAFDEEYQPGGADGVQLVITRRRKATDGEEFGPPVPGRDEFAAAREEIGAASDAAVIMIFNPKSHRGPQASPADADAANTLEHARTVIRAGCFKQVKSAVGIQFVPQSRGAGVQFEAVLGEGGCVRISDWCNGAPQATPVPQHIGIDFSRADAIGPPLGRCMMPISCWSSYSPSTASGGDQRSCLQVEPCDILVAKPASCPAPILSTRELLESQTKPEPEPETEREGEGNGAAELPRMIDLLSAVPTIMVMVALVSAELC